MKIMKTTYSLLLFVLISLTASLGVHAQSPAPSASLFAGTWVLDPVATNTSKDFPRKLKNYRIIVAENETMLNVKSVVEGPVEVEISRDKAQNNSDIISNTASRSSAGRSGPGVSGNTLGTAAPESIAYGGTLAVFLTPNDVTYNLNGAETKLDIIQNGKVNGVARIKAKLDKRGNQIQFTTIRRMNTMKGDIEITIREVWKLSKDGKSLKFERTVETPAARDEIVMVLTRAEA